MFNRAAFFILALILSFQLKAEMHSAYLETTNLSVGVNHVCAKTFEGVKCFGNSEVLTTKVPLDIKNLTQLQAGNRFTCGLTDNGIRCWGEIYGTSKNDILIGKKDLKSPRILAVGYDHACAVGENDKIKCWGKNEFQEGNPPPGLKNITELSSGMSNTCAIADHKIICWGIQSTGSLQVPENLQNPHDLTSGWWHHCVQSDEGVKCWGHPFKDAYIPEGISNTRIVSGGMLNCTLTDEGIKCWNETNIPFLLEGSQNTKSFSMGSSLICANTFDHGVMCWGPRSGLYKRLLSFVPAGGISRIDKIAAGNSGTCAYGDNDLVKCWGINPDGLLDIPGHIPGPLGDFSLGAHRLCTVNKEGPQCFGGQRNDFDLPKNLGDATMISSGGYQICAGNTNLIKCWGDNIRDALDVPKKLKKITQLSSGFTHACAVADNEVNCWGGTGLISGVNPSQKIINPKAICAGGTFSCAIDEKGKVSCWGSKIPLSEDVGKELFGLDTKAVLKVPKQISNAVEISCGLAHACSIFKGQLKCWGDIGLHSDNLNPKVSIKNPHMLTAGWNHTCAMGDNGLNCWGNGINLEMPKYSLEK